MFVSIRKKNRDVPTSFNKNNRFFLFSKGKTIKISRVICGIVYAWACVENINTVWVYSTIIKSMRHWRFYLSTRITYQLLLYILSKRDIVRQIPVFRSYRWKKRIFTRFTIFLWKWSHWTSSNRDNCLATFTSSLIVAHRCYPA